MARSLLFRVLIVVLRVPFAIIYGTLLITVYSILVLIVILVSSPYTLFYFSSNWSMREKHMPPVQLYLDSFQYLYPDLTHAVAAAHAGGMQRIRGDL